MELVTKELLQASRRWKSSEKAFKFNITFNLATSENGSQDTSLESSLAKLLQISKRSQTHSPSMETGSLIQCFCTSVKLLRSRSHSVTSGLSVPGVGYRTLRESGNDPLLVRPPERNESER
jgi:hypothetical protein